MKRIHSRHNFKKQFKRCYENEYSLLTEFSTLQWNWPLKIRHNSCNLEFTTTANNLVYGSGKVNSCICPSCRSLEWIGRKYYEATLYEYLNANKLPGVQIYTQYIVSQCCDIPGPGLPFGFAIYSDGELVLLIECDEQHHFSKNYDKTNDQIKDAYCKKEVIPFIRVPYWEIKDQSNTIAYVNKELSKYIEFVDEYIQGIS